MNVLPGERKWGVNIFFRSLRSRNFLPHLQNRDAAPENIQHSSSIKTPIGGGGFLDPPMGGPKYFLGQVPPTIFLPPPMVKILYNSLQVCIVQLLVLINYYCICSALLCALLLLHDELDAYPCTSMTKDMLQR